MLDAIDAIRPSAVGLDPERAGALVIGRHPHQPTRKLVAVHQDAFRGGVGEQDGDLLDRDVGQHEARRDRLFRDRRRRLWRRLAVFHGVPHLGLPIFVLRQGDLDGCLRLPQLVREVDRYPALHLRHDAPVDRVRARTFPVAAVANRSAPQMRWLGPRVAGSRPPGMSDYGAGRSQKRSSDVIHGAGRGFGATFNPLRPALAKDFDRQLRRFTALQLHTAISGSGQIAE